MSQRNWQNKVFEEGKEIREQQDADVVSKLGKKANAEAVWISTAVLAPVFPFSPKLLVPSPDVHYSSGAKVSAPLPLLSQHYSLPARVLLADGC